jgi:hypothetical protein
VVPVDKEVAYFADQLKDIGQGVLNFHTFLQSWGIVIDKRKPKEEYILDYARALASKPQLDNEVEHLNSYLDRLC